MDPAELVEQVLSAVVDVTPDVLDQVLSALDGGDVDLSSVPEEVLVDTLVGALAIVGGAAVTGLVQAHRPQMEAAVRRAVAGP